MQGWLGGRMEDWKDERMKEWKDERMEEWKDERMKSVKPLCQSWPGNDPRWYLSPAYSFVNRQWTYR